ncbi:odorant receptor 131-2-like [Oncorhynchus kisutch]|uniref:odorant receptor 131-2-like n=1 Tax=Oncorhynchus kisutch TaxID=8019 RepID=UPI0012DC8BB7|nr:odorant receptor 131-2-like [Oncorhynchus kisutch]
MQLLYITSCYWLFHCVIMANNNTTAADGASSSSLQQVNDMIIVVQVMNAIFIYIICLLIFTFFKKDTFLSNTRYIFFAHTLLADCLYLIMTNNLLLLTYFSVTMPAAVCVSFCVLLCELTFVTPLTLTAMSLERYVAICMPLRHGELSTVRRAIHCILLIHSISAIQPIIIVSIFFASVPLGFYTQYKLCSADMFIAHKWQRHLRSVIGQFYFLVMSITIVFTYVRIIAVAKESSDNKKSLSKCRKTVILHAIQLFLCLIQLWCPFIEAAILPIHLKMYNVRFFDYIVFILAPRCLCPLVYGLRDEKFFLAIKCYVFFGVNKNISPILVDNLITGHMKT